MVSEKRVSKSERLSILALSFFAFAYFASFFILDAIGDNNNVGVPHISFPVDDPVLRLPAGLHLFTVFIFLSLIKPKRYIFATASTVVYASLLCFALYSRVNGESFLGGPYPQVGFFAELFGKTWMWDYVGGVFILIMLVWLFSILIRLRTTLYR